MISKGSCIHQSDRKVKHVRLPKFGGSLGEDFATFKSKCLLPMEKNRVPVSDKIEKLRNCLSGQALTLVSEKRKDFFSALKVFSDAFGNPMKVLAVKIQLRSRNQVNVLLTLPMENQTFKLYLKQGVYNPSVRDHIENIFGTQDFMKIRALTGTGTVGLEEHVKNNKNEITFLRGDNGVCKK